MPPGLSLLYTIYLSCHPSKNPIVPPLESVTSVHYFSPTNSAEDPFADARMIARPGVAAGVEELGPDRFPVIEATVDPDWLGRDRRDRRDALVAADAGHE